MSPSIPSIITRGLESFKVPTPLTRIEISSWPASPEFWETNTPAVVPDKARPALVKALFSITSVSIVATEPVIFLLNWVPYPVTTISSRDDSDITSCTDILSESVETIWVSNPIKEISKSESSLSRSNEKLPSKSVVVPLVVPTSITEAPGNPFPSESETLPETFLWTISSSTSEITLVLTFFLRRTFLSTTS